VRRDRKGGGHERTKEGIKNNEKEGRERVKRALKVRSREGVEKEKERDRRGK